MKITQKKISFKPIVLTLETADEARAFLEIMDEVDARTPEAQQMAINLSNAFTECKVEIPEENNGEYAISA